MAMNELINDKTVGLVRNALLIAGEEMGAEGDHWPVINATIHNVMLDYENLKTERVVHSEMKTQLYAQLDEMDRILATCTAEERAEAAPKLTQLREVYDAHFTPIGRAFALLGDDETPIHVRRAEEMILSLEDDYV